MKNKSLILGLIFVAIVAGVIYVSAEPFSKRVDIPAGWKTYSDDLRGLSFSYPVDWSLEREANGDFVKIVDPVSFRDTNKFLETHEFCEVCISSIYFHYYPSIETIARIYSEKITTFTQLTQKFEEEAEFHKLTTSKVEINGVEFYVRPEFAEDIGLEVFSYWAEKNGHLYEISLTPGISPNTGYRTPDSDMQAILSTIELY